MSASRAVTKRFNAKILLKRLPAILMAVLMVVLGFLAVRHEGVPTPRVDLNDGGIWVTNRAKQLVGNLNYDSRSFTGILHTDSAQFDIAQAGNVVTMSDTAAKSVAAIDPAFVSLGTPTSLPERAVYAQGGASLAVLDAGSGNLWVTDAKEPANTQLSDGNAVAADLEGGVVTVSKEGTALAVAPKSGEFVSVDPRGESTQVTRTQMEGVDITTKLAITAVGNRPVALDTMANDVILPDGKRVSLDEQGVESGGLLQEPGPEADHVLIATPTQLVRVKLSNGKASYLPSHATGVVAGTPAPPARLNGCDYSAWGTSGAFLRNCDGDKEPTRQVVDTLQAATELRFRVNREDSTSD